MGLFWLPCDFFCLSVHPPPPPPVAALWHCGKMSTCMLLCYNMTVPAAEVTERTRMVADSECSHRLTGCCWAMFRLLGCWIVSLCFLVWLLFLVKFNFPYAPTFFFFYPPPSHPHMENNCLASQEWITLLSQCISQKDLCIQNIWIYFLYCNSILLLLLFLWHSQIECNPLHGPEDFHTIFSLSKIKKNPHDNK